LNATLLQFVLGHDPKDWQKFSLSAETLDRWLGQQRPGTPREREDLTRIRSTLTAYRTEAGAIAAGSGTGQADVLAVLTKIERASKQLLSLGYDLASAHRTATAELVDTSQKSLTLCRLIGPIKSKEWSVSRKIVVQRVRDVNVRHVQMDWYETKFYLDPVEDQRLHARFAQRLRKTVELCLQYLSDRAMIEL
jgi:hypothetical protein